ncbi:unnamed protein product [Caenorhabditis nigoni]
MSPFILFLLLLVGTSWAFVPDDTEFRGIIEYPHDDFYHDYFLRKAFVPFPDTTPQLVKKFLARITLALEAKDVASISEMIQGGFVFKGCKGTYDKEEFIGLLSRISSSSNFTVTIESVIDTGSYTTFTVDASGIGPASVEAHFMLNKIDQQLEYGQIENCQKYHFVTFGSVQTYAEMVAKRFLSRLTRAIESKNASIIQDCFESEFEFSGCKRFDYTKQEVVETLSKIPTDTQFSFVFKSAYYVLIHVRYTAVVIGILASPIEVEFWLHPSGQQLMYGSTRNCSY